MNENLNLIEVLKNEPKGRKLYSPLFGDVTFIKINKELCIYPIIVKPEDSKTEYFTSKGKYSSQYKDAECLLFPSKEERDWSKFQPTKVDLPIDTPVMVLLRYSARKLKKKHEKHIVHYNAIMIVGWLVALICVIIHLFY